MKPVHRMGIAVLHFGMWLVFWAIPAHENHAEWVIEATEFIAIFWMGVSVSNFVRAWKDGAQ